MHRLFEQGCRNGFYRAALNGGLAGEFGLNFGSDVDGDGHLLMLLLYPARFSSVNHSKDGLPGGESITSHPPIEYIGRGGGTNFTASI